MTGNKEQTTFRLPAELVKKLEMIAVRESMPVSYYIITAAKRIAAKYRFDKRGALLT